MADKAKIDFEGLVPEFFANEPTWLDFMEALADVIQEQIRDPIGEIEDIRHIVESTDPEVVSRTIKQLGFDIPADLIQHNAARLAKSVYMLALFHERSGTVDFVKGVRFVLGRDMQVHHLYTNDYVNFYETPAGPLIADGGDWYKTTHVDLGMELIPSDANMVLPVGKNLSDRLMDAYFEFAPINHVVREFYYLIRMQATVGLAGKILWDGRDYITIGLGGEILRTVEALLPGRVDAGTILPVYTDLIYYSLGCYDVQPPRYGNAAAGLKDGDNFFAHLTTTLPNTEDTALIVEGNGQFAYFAYPAALGRASFINPVSGIAGGWDGAGWPANGSIGDSTGPIRVVLDTDGRDQEWFVYRTDMPINGHRTWQVQFEHPGLRNSCDLRRPIPTPTPEPAPEQPDEDDDRDPCVENLHPTYGTHTVGLNSDAQIEFLEQSSENNNDQRFTVNVGEAQYGYFAYPVELGYATFTDVTTGIEGGWDGATWGEEPEDSTGPIVVIRSICGKATEWYVYRTDMPAIGERTFDVAFNNPGAEIPVFDDDDDEEDGCVSGYPTFFVGPIGSDVSQAMVSYEAYVMDSTENTTISGLLEEDEYGFFAHPVELGVATITERSSDRSDLWDGAGWPNDGAEGITTGPIVIQRAIEGKVYDWYLYRTNVDNLGEVAFDITFPNAGLCVNTDIAYPPSEPADPEDPNEDEDEADDPILDLPCAVNALPRFGAISSLYGKTPDDLLSELPSTDSQPFTITIPEGTYGYMVYPAALGLATFTDTASNLTGGWNGATWDEEGTIGDSYGPAVISYTKNGVTSRWYVYRTSWPGLGTFTFQVTFEKPGLELGHVAEECDTGDVPAFEPKALQATVKGLRAASAPQLKSTSGCVVNAYPRYGSGNNISNALQVKHFADEASVTDNHRFTVRVPQGEYGWYAHPAALGVARFTDVRSNVEGGWDGARWPEGTVEFSTGPVLIRLQDNGVETPWFLYRTDFPSLGEATFNVFFENNGLSLGDSIQCRTQGIPAPIVYGGSSGTTQTRPVFGATDAPVENNTDINEYLKTEILDISLPVFTLSVPAGHHGYLAYPAFLGYAKIESRNGDVVWEGKNSDHPMYVYRRVEGELQTWFLYKTKLPGIGTHTFDVTFGSAGRADPSGRRVIRITPPIMTTDRPDIVSFDHKGFARFAPVYRDTTVHITTTFDNHSDTRAVLVKARGPVLEYIRIAAPNSIDGKGKFNVTVSGRYNDGHTRPVDDAEIRILSQYVMRINGYEVHTGNPPTDTVLHVEARYVGPDSNHHVAVAPVILKSVVLDLKVDNFYIIGPNEITEGDKQTFRAHAFYNDGTQRDVLALWESSSPGLHIDQSGVATAGTPEADFQATLKVTYQLQGIKYVANKVVEIKRSYITAKRLFIEGPDRVIELSDTVYRAFIEWSNGAVTRVDPQWSSNRFSIDDNGVFTSGSVGSSVPVELVARAQGFSVNKIISVFDTPIEIEHVNVIGQENVREGIPTKFRALAHFSNNRDVEVYPKWTLVSPYPGVSMTSEGELTFSGGPAGIVEVQAAYDNGVRIYRQTKPIVLIPNVTLITGLVIHGESELLEGKRVHLKATAIYEDGSTELVEPLWTVRSPDPFNAPEPMADIVSPGIVQGRSVDQDTVVIVEARYFREVAEFPIIVKLYDRPGSYVPLDGRVSGPSLLPVSQVGSYVMWIEFDNGCGQEIAVSNDWSIDVGDDIAIIDQNGFLRSTNNKDADIVVTAEWGCDGHTVTRQMNVRLIAEQSNLQALFIRGPEIVNVRSYATYQAELFRIEQPVVEGEGEFPSRNVTWSVETIIPGVAIDNQGLLYMGAVPDGTQIIIKAVYTEGYHQVEATKAIIARDPDPVEPPDDDDPIDEVSYVPVYGTGPGGIVSYEEMRQHLDNEMPTGVSGETFTTDTTGWDYIYFSHPASLGLARFTEINSGLDGGMDGASWPSDGSIGDVWGPIEITRIVEGNEETWYLYRSDFPGLGEITFRVTYMPE